VSTDVEKPWGWYEDIYREDRVVFKTLCIKPGKAISLQRHADRGEFWFVAEGEGSMTYQPVTNPSSMSHFDVKAGTPVHIEKGRMHRIRNTGDVDLLIYEMQYGLCRESDIVRVMDDFGRA